MHIEGSPKGDQAPLPDQTKADTERVRDFFKAAWP